MPYTVYILLCSDNTLYTGITTDIDRRVREHNGELPGGARYTRPRRPVQVVYQSDFANRAEACSEEAKIKKLARKQKEELVRSADNPGMMGYNDSA